MARVTGVTIDSHVDEITEEMQTKINAWLEKIGQDAASTAANQAPIDTSRLKNSISHAVVEDEKTVYIGTNVDYAIYHELGTGKFASGGRKGGWSYQDANGKWHHTEGVPAKHFLQFGVSAHAAQYKEQLETILKE